MCNGITFCLRKSSFREESGADVRSWDGLWGGGCHTSPGRGSSGTLSPWEEEEGRLKLHSTQKTTPGKSNFNININNGSGEAEGRNHRGKDCRECLHSPENIFRSKSTTGDCSPRLPGNRSAWGRQVGLLSSGSGCVCTCLRIPVFDEHCWTKEEKGSTRAETCAHDGDGGGSKQELKRVTLKS